MRGILDRIGKIVESINQISRHTQLISLNAKVESARAGKAGEAFGVVSNEVSILAEHAAKAAEKIDLLVLDSKELVDGL